MCGIYLRYNFSEITDEEILDSSALIKKISHRGPDETILKQVSTNAAVGFCRLAIREIESGIQPYTTSNYVSAINGELYNQDLIVKWILSVKPDMQLPKGDMQILAVAIDIDPIKALTLSDGMFAGFLYYPQSEKILVFRDPVGEKPVYVNRMKNYLEVLSEHHLDRQLETESEHKSGTTKFRPDGFSETVRMVDPGTIESLDLKNMTLIISKYWHWPSWHANSKGFSESKWYEGFERVIEETVVSRMVSDVPICTLLSGGLDSSIVSHVVQKNSSRPQTAFTFAIPNSGQNEVDSASKIAQKLGLKHEIVSFSFYEIAERIPKILMAIDVPFFDTGCIPYYALCERVSQEYKVCLGGDGGDELFRGYRIFREVDKINHVLAFPRTSLVGLRLLNEIIKLQRLFPSRYFDLKSTIPRLITILQSLDFDPNEVALDQLAGTEFFKGVGTLRKNQIQNKMSRDRLEEIYLKNLLPGSYLRKTDLMSMAHGLEIRSPLLSKNLIEKSREFPLELLEKRHNKYPLRKYAERNLSGIEFSKSKVGFSFPFLKVIPYLSEPVWDLDVLGIESDVISKFWNNSRDLNQNYGFALWKLLVLNSFLQKHAGKVDE
jgi:asparagine synthase (glutamine-hydrolysing)